MSPYPRPGEKVEEKKRTPRDGVEYVPSSLHPSSYSHNPDHPFPNDLLHFPHATTDIHAHVMVCDLIDDEKSVAMIADDWHLTFAQTDHIASLPIVDREVEALKKLVKLRAELMSLVYGDRAIRSLARVANMPLLEPGTREYTESAANARASLVRLASTALLADARRRTARRGPSASEGVSSDSDPHRTASASERTSSPGGTALQSGDSDGSPVPSKSAADFDAASSQSFDEAAPVAPTTSRTANVSERASDSETPSQPVHCGGAAGALDGLPLASDLTSDANSRVACLGEGQACSDDSANSADSPADSHGCAVRGAPRGATMSPAPSGNTPGRTEPPTLQSPADALRAAAGSTHTVRDPSRRSRDRPAA